MLDESGKEKGIERQLEEKPTTRVIGRLPATVSRKKGPGGVFILRVVDEELDTSLKIREEAAEQLALHNFFSYFFERGNVQRNTYKHPINLKALLNLFVYSLLAILLYIVHFFLAFSSFRL